MKFLEFISTERKRYLEKDECIHLLKTNCGASLKNKYTFYRGFEHVQTHKYMMLDGSAGSRNSKMGNNNLLIYTNKLYKEDPLYQDRSKCTIMSTELMHAKRFGEAYRIIPYDDAILSYTNNYVDMNNMRIDFKNKHGYDDDLSITSLFTSIEKSSSFKELMQKIKTEIESKNTYGYFDNIAHLVDVNNITASFEKLFDKNLIDIKSVKCTNFSSYKMHEVWTEEKCIAIHNDEYYSLLKELKSE